MTSKKVDDPVNEDSDRKVFEIYNETISFMASLGSKVNNLKVAVKWVIKACMNN